MLGLQRALAAVSTRDLNGSRRAGKPAESKASETAMIHLTAATAVCGAAEWPRLGAKGPPCIATQWALWARTKFEIPLTLTPRGAFLHIIKPHESRAGQNKVGICTLLAGPAFASRAR
ncbi:predicted protein [Pyrenophora tritici-repentis Pt-1C-BFP]|uniref:Uncharacterized protein n=1 Tax=Pyrenophora tritici-repentis (strain Pt-1C-BFP) TaxID=426418 RepID=B2WC86_PYRTR|nr:uncharacterized protein PTRG_07595 [Pyrenophora tritici-repentis Pt-1C-BFP]EDU50514.1 predicted protein [Pyrenophora tritici-repentis Pt-1C-BFP]